MINDKVISILKGIGIVLILSIIVYIAIQFLFIKPKNGLIDYKQQIIEQVQDSIIKPYKDSIVILTKDKIVLTKKLDSLSKVETTIRINETVIKEVYREKLKYIDRYTNDDINQYFYNRYGTGTAETGVDSTD
jgi:hypothetical protein